MKTQTTTAFKAILPLAAILLSTTAVQAEDINKSFDGVKSIRITVASGDVILKKSKNKKVTVQLNENFSFDYKPELSQDGSRLVINDKETRRNNRRNYRGHAEWTLTVPNDMDVDFRTGSGSLEVTNLTIDVDMKSGSGSVDIEGSKGEFDISTGSGSADITSSSGVFDISTGSGGADIEDSTGEFDISTGSGSLRSTKVKITGNSEFSTGSGSVTGKGLTLGADISFSTGSGDVDLRLAKGSSHNISLSSGSGDATLDLNGAKLEGTLVMKAGKRRGDIEAPFDFDTEEEIENRWGSDTVEKTKVFSKKDVRVKISTGSGTAKVTK
jgi:hypothetical protein